MRLPRKTRVPDRVYRQRGLRKAMSLPSILLYVDKLAASKVFRQDFGICVAATQGRENPNWRVGEWSERVYSDEKGLTKPFS